MQFDADLFSQFFASTASEQDQILFECHVGHLSTLTMSDILLGNITNLASLDPDGLPFRNKESGNSSSGALDVVMTVIHAFTSPVRLSWMPSSPFFTHVQIPFGESFQEVSSAFKIWVHPLYHFAHLLTLYSVMTFEYTQIHTSSKIMNRGKRPLSSCPGILTDPLTLSPVFQ
jgi:hypothetical protein